MLNKMNVAFESAEADNLPDWAKWKGQTPEPSSWWAVNPETGERTKIYRSYEDYVGD